MYTGIGAYASIHVGIRTYMYTGIGAYASIHVGIGKWYRADIL